jgi:hypothetical protein
MKKESSIGFGEIIFSSLSAIGLCVISLAGVLGTGSDIRWIRILILFIVVFLGTFIYMQIEKGKFANNKNFIKILILLIGFIIFIWNIIYVQV